MDKEDFIIGFSFDALLSHENAEDECTVDSTLASSKVVVTSTLLALLAIEIKVTILNREDTNLSRLTKKPMFGTRAMSISRITVT